MKEIAQKFLCDVEKIYIHFGEKSPELDEFIINRKITEESVKTFGLGYAPKGNVIYEYTKKYELRGIAFDLGLIRSRDEHFYDIFRDRVIIPIRDEYGKCIGFAGRATSSEQIPKYLINPNSPLLNREEHVFGLDVATGPIQKENAVILVEGIMDMISLYDQGFTNTVALMGYRLTEKRIEKLKKLTQNFYVMTNTDKAGKKACEMVCKALIREGINPYVVDISPFGDPNELVNASENTQANLRELIKSTRQIVFS